MNGRRNIFTVRWRGKKRLQQAYAYIYSLLSSLSTRIEMGVLMNLSGNGDGVLRELVVTGIGIG